MKPDFTYAASGFSTLQQFFTGDQWKTTITLGDEILDQWSGLTAPGLEIGEAPFVCSCCRQEVIVDLNKASWPRILQNHLEGCNSNVAYLLREWK